MLSRVGTGYKNGYNLFSLFAIPCLRIAMITLKFCTRVTAVKEQPR